MIVAFTANNRPRYLRETLDSWAKVRGVEDADLIFRCEPGCPPVEQMCRGATFGASLSVTVNPVRYGPLSNPWRCFHEGFGTGADFVVLAEDDSPVADDVLEWFAWARDRFANRSKVLAVCAFQRHVQPGGPHGAVLAPWFRPTVWGTWADRWQNLLRDDWDHDYRHKGWDWRIIEHWIGERGYLCAAPCQSRSQVSGEFGGTHLHPGAQYQEHLSRCFSPSYPPGEFTEVPCESS